jgi:hypothetical protein
MHDQLGPLSRPTMAASARCKRVPEPRPTPNFMSPRTVKAVHDAVRPRQLEPGVGGPKPTSRLADIALCSPWRRSWRRSRSPPRTCPAGRWRPGRRCRCSSGPEQTDDGPDTRDDHDGTEYLAARTEHPVLDILLVLGTLIQDAFFQISFAHTLKHA